MTDDHSLLESLDSRQLQEVSVSPGLQALWQAVLPMVGILPSQPGEFAGVFKVEAGPGRDEATIYLDIRSDEYTPGHDPRMERVIALITRLPAASTGLVRIAACTSGAMLTSRRALEAVGDPWWTLGQYPGKPDEWNDDLWFCQRLADVGIELWGDPTTRCGHIADIEVWPHEQGGQWTTVLARGSTPFAALPMESTRLV